MLTDGNSGPGRAGSKDEPYYWRVRAVDGALNESGWTGTGSFYVGFAGLPQWVIYTLLGVGALVLGGVGFWVGRTTASREYSVE